MIGHPPKMSWGDAAEKVLRMENRPLHYTSLARHILQDGLADTKGKTPALACYTSLWSDNDQRRKKGKQPRFVIKRGFVRLTDWTRKRSQTLQVYTQAQRDFQKVKNDFLTRLRQLDGREFEKYVEQLIIRMGYDKVAYSKKLDRKGIDFICEIRHGINEVKTAVQVKNKGYIGPKEIRYLRDVLEDFGCSQGVFITTGSFGSDAQDVATAPGRLQIVLIDGDELAERAAAYNVGITSQMLKVYAIDERHPSLSRASPTRR